MLARAGFETHRTFPHRLGKATYNEHQIDIGFVYPSEGFKILKGVINKLLAHMTEEASRSPA